MKVKTIKKVIDAKMNEWFDSIDNSTVKSLVKKNTIVTGGAIASMLLPEPVNDFDVYFRNRETALAVAKYYVSKFHPKNKAGIEVPLFVWDAREQTKELHPLDVDRIKVYAKSAGIASEEGTEKNYEYFEGNPEAASDYVGDIIPNSGDAQDIVDENKERLAIESENDGKPKYRPVFVTSNAITLSGKIQIITRFWGEPEEIHGNYDYVHCMNYWTSWKDQHIMGDIMSPTGGTNLVLKQEALECLLAKELRYSGSLYPIASIVRMRKFINRGWSINAGQILKMAFQISKLDLEDVKVLENQLQGVDQAYFSQLLQGLKAEDSRVDMAYIVEIIDRIM